MKSDFLVFALFLAGVYGNSLFSSSSVVQVDHPGVPNLHGMPAKYKTLAIRANLETSGPLMVAPDTHVFDPVSYGADPSGVNDSSPAFTKLVIAMLALNPDSPDWVRDLGGATVALSGGAYRLTSPISFPPNASNFFMRDGTLFADPSFPPGRFLLEIGVGCERSGVDGGASSCGRDFGAVEVSFHGNNFAGGCVRVSSFQFASLGPAFLCTGFEDHGILFDGTGGSYVSSAWLGQYDAWSPDKVTPNATGISIDGTEHDSYVYKTIIWSAGIGVASRNGANQLEGIHTWNLAAADNGIGILMEVGKGRIVNCYLDFAPLVAIDPNGLVVSDSFFLGFASVQLVASSPNTSIQSLVITSNLFVTGNKSITLDETNGTFTSLQGVIVENNAYADPKITAVSTSATKQATAAQNMTLWFDDALAFNLPIQVASCTLLNSLQPLPIAIQINDRSIQLVFPDDAQLQHAFVSCTVDQSQRLYPAH